MGDEVMLNISSPPSLKTSYMNFFCTDVPECTDFSMCNNGFCHNVNDQLEITSDIVVSVDDDSQPIACQSHYDCGCTATSTTSCSLTGTIVPSS